MIRRPPRSTLDRSSAASDVYKRQVPGLATILVGDDAASAGYVRKKHEACASAGFWSENIHLPASTTEDELHATVDRLNADSRVHAFLIQHPLPPRLDFG